MVWQVYKVQVLMMPMLKECASFENHHDNTYGLFLWDSKKTCIRTTWQSVNCLCTPLSILSLPSFVGNDYYCVSGCPAHGDVTTFHAADPLWDEERCGALEAECCPAPGLPWFHKVLDDALTTDYIEMRLCTDEPTTNENVLISFYEIYGL